MRNWSGTFLLVLAMAGAALSCAPFSSPTPPSKSTTPKAWSIGVMSGRHPLSLRENQSCPNPRFTKDDVLTPRSLFVADPFLVRGDQKWLLFFELFNIRSNKGEIGLAESADLCDWKFKEVVLAEPFHLSYPFVFRTAGTYYMVPESRQAKSVRLYKATHFPTQWRLEKVLIDGDYADSTPVYFNRKWWIFTNRSPYTLVLFYADSVKGPWKQHPQSPRYENDASRARPAGRPVVIDGTLLRFVQDNRGGYGKRLRAMVVDKLTTTEFQEHIAEPDPLFDGKDASWSEEGIHHIAPVVTANSEWVAVLDGNRRSAPEELEENPLRIQKEASRKEGLARRFMKYLEAYFLVSLNAPLNSEPNDEVDVVVPCESGATSFERQDRSEQSRLHREHRS